MNFLNTTTGIADILINPVTRARAAYNLIKLAYKYNTVKRKKTIPDDIKTIAHFAAAAYEPSRPTNLYGFELDQEISTDEIAVYVSNDQVIISFRGTDNKTDIIVSDLQIAFSALNKNSSRVVSALKLTGEVVKKYPNYDYLLTGHSLGASIADLVGTITNIKTISFNIGAGIGIRSDCRTCTHHVIAGDPISNSVIGNLRGANIVVYDKQNKKLNAHTIRQFL